MSTSTRRAPSTLDYAFCYALWLIAAAIVLADAYIVWMWVREGYVLVQGFRWGFAAAYEFGLVIVGLIWLCVVIALEFYFRRWLVKGRLWPRFRLFAAIALIPVLLRLVSMVVSSVL